MVGDVDVRGCDGEDGPGCFPVGRLRCRSVGARAGDDDVRWRRRDSSSRRSGIGEGDVKDCADVSSTWMCTDDEAADGRRFVISG